MQELNIHKLEWDSNFFGLSIYQASFNGFVTPKVVSSLNASCADLIYLRLKENQISSISDNIKNFLYIDRQIEFAKRLSVPPPSSLPLGYKIKEIDFIDDKVSELIYTSGLYSRFFCDPFFQSSLAKKLYKKWTQNAINTSGDMVLSLIYIDEIVGFITLHRHRKNYSIGLFAISPFSQKRGLARALLNYSENILAKQGVTNLKVKTQQKNIPAINCYITYGFVIQGSSTIAHYWPKQHSLT